VRVKEVETEKCGTVFQSAICECICKKSIGHFGKHFDFDGTTWTDAGARLLKEKEEEAAARLQKE
jgi:hypothetical protein